MSHLSLTQFINLNIIYMYRITTLLFVILSFATNSLLSQRCAVEVTKHSTASGEIYLVASAKGVDPIKYEWSNGETGQRTKVVKDGKYCVRIKDATGCVAEDCLEIVGNDKKCSVEIVKGPSTSASNSVLCAKITGQGPFKIEWSTGENTRCIRPQGKGEYCVYVVNAEGCEAKTCVKIDGPSDKRCAVRIKKLKITTASGRTVLLAQAKGKAPFKYSWSTGETTQRILVEKPGEYCVTIVDSEGCEARTCIKVDGQNADRCAVRIRIMRGIGTVGGSVVLVAETKGKAPFKYSWSTGETTKRIKVGKEGEYCVKIEDANGCTSHHCIKVSFANDRKCAVEIKVTERDNGVCVLTAFAKGEAPFKYEWSNGNTGEAIKVDQSGKYCVTVTDSKGCKARNCIEVKKDDARCAVEISAERTNSGTIILTANAKGEDPINYYWSNGETTRQIKVDKEGEYCVKIEDAKGCIAKDCIKIGGEKCAVKIEVSRTGQGIVLTAHADGQAPYKYEWSTGANSARILVDRKGEYCVKIVDSNGCEAKACVDVKGFIGNGGVKLELSPNPAFDKLIILSDEKIKSVRILSFHGDEQIRDEFNDDLNVIDLSIAELNPGIYIVEVETLTGKSSSKFIKK